MLPLRVSNLPVTYTVAEMRQSPQAFSGRLGGIVLAIPSMAACTLDNNRRDWRAEAANADE